MTTPRRDGEPVRSGGGPDRDAVGRYCRGASSNDADLMLSAFSADAELISPVSGSMVFRGRDDLAVLLTAVYSTVRELRWGPVIGEGDVRVVLGDGRVGPVRVTDAMVLELDADGAVRRLRPHLRPWWAITVFAAMMVPRLGRHPGVVRRAVRTARLRE